MKCIAVLTIATVFILSTFLLLTLTVPVSSASGPPSLQVTETPTVTEPVTDAPNEADDSAVLSEIDRDNIQPGDYGVTILSGGLVRRYLLHIPTGYDGETLLPLLISFHGFTGTPVGNARGTGFSQLADEEGFVAVYPEGSGEPKGWFAHENAELEFPDDVQFTRDIINQLVNHYAIDPSRIYITGFSNGGGMAHRIGCDLATIVAAMTAIGGTHLEEDPCRPTRALPVLGIHGRDDDVTPYLGFGLALESIPEWAQEWAERNACIPLPLVDTSTPNLTIETWQACANGVQVQLYTYDVLGHALPPGAARIVWDFVSQYQLTEAEVEAAGLIGNQLETGDYRITVASGGVVRSYLLHVPEGYDSTQPMPVLINFHDFGSNPLGDLQLTGWYAQSDEQGFILVLPEGRGDPLAWFTEAKAPEGFPTDTQFLRDILSRLSQDLTIDIDRIYLSGFSLGGGMAHRAACDVADLVAGIIVVNGAHWTDQPCQPSQAVPVIAVHGFNNATIPYTGFPDRLMGIPEWAQAWADANGCQGEPEITTPEDGMTLSLWVDCQAPVELITLNVGGHEWNQNLNTMLWEFISTTQR